MKIRQWQQSAEAVVEAAEVTAAADKIVAAGAVSLKVRVKPEVAPPEVEVGHASPRAPSTHKLWREVATSIISTDRKLGHVLTGTTVPCGILNRPSLNTTGTFH